MCQFIEHFSFILFFNGKSYFIENYEMKAAGNYPTLDNFILQTDSCRRNGRERGQFSSEHWIADVTR